VSDGDAWCNHKVRPEFVEHGEHFARVTGRCSTAGHKQLAYPNNRRLARVDDHTNCD
jgi:hypothetical protein